MGKAIDDSAGESGHAQRKTVSCPRGKPHKICPNCQPERGEAKYDPSRVDEDGGLSAIPGDDR